MACQWMSMPLSYNIFSINVESEWSWSLGAPEYGFSKQTNKQKLEKVKVKGKKKEKWLVFLACFFLVVRSNLLLISLCLFRFIFFLPLYKVSQFLPIYLDGDIALLFFLVFSGVGTCQCFTSFYPSPLPTLLPFCFKIKL